MDFPDTIEIEIKKGDQKRCQSGAGDPWKCLIAVLMKKKYPSAVVMASHGGIAFYQGSLGVEYDVSLELSEVMTNFDNKRPVKLGKHTLIRRKL